VLASLVDDLNDITSIPAGKTILHRSRVDLQKDVVAGAIEVAKGRLDQHACARPSACRKRRSTSTAT
jgi:hypothetical protein